MSPQNFNLKIHISFYTWSFTSSSSSCHTSLWQLSSLRMAWSKKREAGGPVPRSCLVPPCTDCHPWNHSQLSASWLHCHPSAKSRGQRDAVARNTCPTLPLPGGQSSVWPFGAPLMQTRFPGRWWSRKCQLHLPFHFLFPQIYGASLFSHHVTALCHSSPCGQTSQTI